MLRGIGELVVGDEVGEDGAFPPEITRFNRVPFLDFALFCLFAGSLICCTSAPSAHPLLSHGPLSRSQCRPPCLFLPFSLFRRTPHPLCLFLLKLALHWLLFPSSHRHLVRPSCHKVPACPFTLNFSRSSRRCSALRAWRGCSLRVAQCTGPLTAPMSASERCDISA